MPTRYNAPQARGRQGILGAGRSGIFDEDKGSIAMRIRRLNTGMAWAEDPPSRTRHMVSNVVIRPIANPIASDEYEVDCLLHAVSIALEREVEIFVGMRHDLIRRANNPAGFQVGGARSSSIRRSAGAAT